MFLLAFRAANATALCSETYYLMARRLVRRFVELIGIAFTMVVSLFTLTIVVTVVAENRHPSAASKATLTIVDHPSGPPRLTHQHL